MTKIRSPLSIERALNQVVREIGVEHAARVTGRRPSYLRKLTDEDDRSRLTVRDAILLGRAWRAHPRRRSLPLLDPIFATYSVLANEQPEECPSAEQLCLQTAAVVKEDGEANEALIRASLPSATQADVARAICENEEAIAARTTALRMLSAGGRTKQGGPGP